MDVNGQFHEVAALIPGESAPLPAEEEGWMGTRPGLDAMEKRKVSFPCQKSNHDSLEVQPIA
jgi:hypothetical protein